MIQSISNNFGCDPIQIKDYQDSEMVILNTKFTFDPTNADYLAADVLEIKVPDLSIPKSAVAFAYQTSFKEVPNFRSFNLAMVVRSWIKDKNTICIEKFPIFDELEDVTIWIMTMYAVLGRRGELQPYDPTEVTCDVVTPTELVASEVACVVKPGWVFFHMYFKDAKVTDQAPITVNLEGFPDDVDFDVPLIGGNQFSGYNGCLYAPGTVSNGVFHVEKADSLMRDTGEDPFVMFYYVR